MGKKFLIGIGKSVALEFTVDSIYRDGKIHINIDNRSLPINIQDTLFQKCFKSIVILSRSIKSMYDDEMYDIRKLKMLYTALEYYCVMFPFHIIDVVYHVFRYIVEMVIEGILDEEAQEACVLFMRHALSNKVYTDVFEKIMNDVLSEFGVSLKNYDISRTIRQLAYRIGINTVAPITDMPTDLELLPTTDKSTYYRIKNGQVEVYDTTNNYVLISEVFNRIIFYTKEGKATEHTYTDMIRKLNSVDSGLASWVKLPSNTVPHVVLHYVLESLHKEII